MRDPEGVFEGEGAFFHFVRQDATHVHPCQGQMPVDPIHEAVVAAESAYLGVWDRVQVVREGMAACGWRDHVGPAHVDEDVREHLAECACRGMALPVKVLQRKIRDSIESAIDMQALQNTFSMEEDEKHNLSRLLARGG